MPGARALLHSVTFDVRGLAAADVDAVTAGVASLNGIDEVRWAAIGDSIDQPGTVTIFVALDPDEGALARYRDDPVHLAVAEVMRGLGVTADKRDWHIDWPS